MIRSVLVPLDGSGFAEHALPAALTIARRANAGLNLVLVHVPLAAVGTSLFPDLDAASDRFVKQSAEGYLVSLAQRIQKAANVRVTATVVEGPIVPALRDRAGAGGADLVVMTTHGRGPLARFWMGSVADQLLREVTVPLLLLRPQDGPVNLEREALFRHWLIPLDGSPLAEQAIAPAVALGSLAEADYLLLRIVPPRLLPPFMDSVPPAPIAPGDEMLKRLDELHIREIKDADDYVKRQGTALAARMLRVQTRVVSADPPAENILDEVKPSGIDAIALATHGRSGLGRLVLGSVADKVVRGAGVPVLVCRPQAR